MNEQTIRRRGRDDGLDDQEVEEVVADVADAAREELKDKEQMEGWDG